MTSPGKAKSVVYVDGFNLYYGALKGTRHRWLDLDALFRRLRPHDDIQLIRYFTARVTGRTRNPDMGKRQGAYLRALSTTPLVEVHLGRFKMKKVPCKVPTCTAKGDRRFDVPEEKRTDVNIALFMLDDSYQDRCDRLVLVTGDSDLVPAVDMVKDRFPAKEVIVYVPSRSRTRGAAVEIRNAADRDKTLPNQLIAQAQFPPSVRVDNVTVAKPARW